jgi:hypothetical protein
MPEVWRFTQHSSANCSTSRPLEATTSSGRRWNVADAGAAPGSTRLAETRREPARAEDRATGPPPPRAAGDDEDEAPSRAMLLDARDVAPPSRETDTAHDAEAILLGSKETQAVTDATCLWKPSRGRIFL